MSRLIAIVNFKTGTGRMQDPETGKYYDNFLVDWDVPPREGEGMTLHFRFEEEEIEIVDDPWKTG